MEKRYTLLAALLVWCGVTQAQWSKVDIVTTPGFNVSNLYLDGNTVWAGGTGKIYRSTDGGNSWTEVSTGLQSAISNNSGITRLGNRVYASFAGNGNWFTYYTTDEGQNWMLDTAGWQGPAPIQLHTYKDYVLARLESNFILYKKNTDAKWNVLPLPSTHRTPGAMYTVGDSLVLGIGYTASTVDMGVNWTVRSFPVTGYPMGFFNGLHQNQTKSNEVYSNWQILANSKNFLTVSRDNQYTWDSVELPVPAPARVTAAWVKGNDVFVAYEGSFTAGDTLAKVFYSADAGNTWSNITYNLYSLVQFKFHSANSFVVLNGNLLIGGLSSTGLFKYNLGTTGLPALLNSNSLRFYPNPATSSLNFTQAITHLTISDFTGKIVLQTMVKNRQVDISELPKGLYLITGYAGDEVYQSKLLKE